MPTLDPTLRDQLAVVVGKENRDDGARAIAEAGARAGLEALAVHIAVPHSHLDESARALRNRLRARARQLGDTRLRDGAHDIGHLVEQCAYEHWHRMLFARFLAENDLLIHPEYRTAVTLAECAELAVAEGARDAWELAARYASRMLPQIFRADDPVLEVRLPPEHIHELERLLASLPSEVFKASDSLGWVYQFWQARRKKAVNASEVKIGADELPAVTQLFTEPYMVQFLLQNTLGAWWVGAGRALPMEMPYLRTLDDGTPAAGRFEGWPEHARELKVLDPCCGSGHFLVAAFEILARFRIQEERLGAREACDAVLRDNLYGLEIDERCTQIAAFALALATWSFPGAGGYRVLPDLHVACSGLAPRAKQDEWLALAGGDERLRSGMERLHRLFQHAPTLGSLIELRSARGDLLEAGFSERGEEVARALAQEEPEEARLEMGITARGLAAAADILAKQYTLVVTNVPYLSRVKQGGTLQELGDAAYEDAKYDLATMFLERNARLVPRGGTVATVVPQNWLYQDYYIALRSKFLTRHRQVLTAILGAGAFEAISGEVVKPALVIFRLDPPAEHLVGMDCSDDASPSEKALALRVRPLSSERIAEILATKDKRIVFGSNRSLPPLADFVDYHLGLCSGDFPRFGRCFWEVSPITDGWAFEQTTVERTCDYGGLHYIFLWEGGRGDFYRFVCERLGEDGVAAWIRGGNAWGKEGVAVSPTGEIKVARYAGELFDNNTIVLTPKQERLFPAVWAFCSSEEFGREVRRIDKALKVTSGLARVPFDLVHWQKVAAERYPDGLPVRVSSEPTDWIFKGAVQPSAAPLQVTVARLVGYRWPYQEPDGLEALADDDGIVCIPPVRGERSAADRITELLARAYRKEWHAHRVNELLARVGFGARTLEEWLRNGFFEQHCRLFYQRPFIWQIWDGHREGFSALVNYHQLGAKALESLTYTYLGEWIAMQDRANKAGESGSGDRLAKARVLQKKLEHIMNGEAPYDIFVRWKPLERQPIGWEPDLADGVRLNIRPFVEAGVLRWKTTIKWGKDRGKSPLGSPWGEERNNDVHLTLAGKRRARGLA